MRCPECRSLNSDTSLHCAECGEVLVPRPATSPADIPDDLFAAREAVRQLRRYVPSIVAEGILHDQERLRGERREAAVLFADAVDFTRLAASLDAESVFNLMNDLLGRLVACVQRYDGLVDKFTGDGLMAVFGAPIAHENDSELAVRAALDMQTAAVEFEPIARAQLGAPLRIRIGIHSGPVVAGVLGTEERVAYTVIGETVNLAARLEALARPSSILVGDRVYQQTQALFNFQAMGMTQIKGVAQPMAVYEVMGGRAEPLPLQGVAGVTAVLLGREAEMEQLSELSKAFLEDRHGRLVTIEGEAGLGKTRLVSEWLSPMAFAQVPVWYGRGLPYARGIGYGVFCSLLQDVVRTSESAGPASGEADWDAGVEQNLRPFLRQLLEPGDPEEQEALRQLDPERVKQLTVLALREWVLAQARLRPIVLVLEDLHDADDLSRDALRSLVNLIHEAPILLCITTRPRPEAPLDLAVLPADEPLTAPLHLALKLRPISPEHSKALLGHLVALGDLPDHLVHTILTRAEGNPFYIEEFVRMLVEKEVLRLGDGQWQVASTVEWQTVEISATLRGMMMARVDRLPQNLRQVLRNASVIGVQFDAQLLEEVERRLHGTANVLPLLERLTDLGMLVERSQVDERMYTFRHVLTRGTIYGSLLRSQRPTLHRTVAECIEYLYADDLRNHAEELALHYDRAYVRAKAMRYVLLAGERARERFANRKAIEYYGRALQLSQHLGGYGAERWQAAVGLGEVLQHVGEHEEAIACYQAALEEWESASPEARAWTMLRLGQAWDKRNELEEAEGWLRQGLAQLSQARTKLPELRARLYAELGWLSLRGGDVATARDWLGQGLDLVGATHHYDVLASIFDRLGVVHYRRSEWTEAAKCVERALEHLEQLGDVAGCARSLGHLAQIKWANGNWANALVDCERAVELYERIGEVEGLAQAHIHLGVMHLDRGEWDQAEEHLRRSLEIAQSVAQPRDLARAHVHLGRLYLLQERWVDAGQHLNAAIPISAEAGALTGEDLGRAYGLQSALYLMQGRIDVAVQWAERCGSVLRQASGTEEGDSVEWGRYEQLRGRIAMAEGDLQAAGRHLKRSTVIFQGRGAQLEVGRSAYWNGLLAQAQHRPDKAREELERAREVFERLGAAADLERVELQLAGAG